MKKNINLRYVAAQTIEKVIKHSQSLSNALPSAKEIVGKNNAALLQELCYGVLRTMPKLEWIIGKLMSRPMTGKQYTLHFLIMVGLYQLMYMRIPAHAVIAETVEGVVEMKRPQLKGLINGVLRQFQRQQAELMQQMNIGDRQYLHPKWLLDRLKYAWPKQWQSIVTENNQRPPMWLRVNRQHHSRNTWLTFLQKSGRNAFAHPQHIDALRLEFPCAVNQLPGFEQGWVTVQDVSAQYCMALLEPKNGEMILDLCAAPGGKTTHILEVAPHANVMSVDINVQRLAKISENLQRLNMQATVKQGDGRTPSIWCGTTQFDRILLDAPCSATGVIRRHPDIKWLRRDRDITELAVLQGEILDAIWAHLKPGGILLYVTCSVLPEENYLQISNFLQCHSDAYETTEAENLSHPGTQIFPQEAGGDGFYYAKLIKES